MIGLPEHIGRYRVEAILGTGGFATVYRARDDRLDATVAVKVLAENHSVVSDVRERFLKEARVLRRIGSPHVVAVHDVGETERGQPYMVLDHCDRGTLAERTRTRRAAGWRPGTADLLYLAEALADALAAVHASHLVHRDVSPRNLLLRSARASGTGAGCDLLGTDERLLLADLGLSKDLAAASGLTIGGGTAGFTPPEQRTGTSRVDAAADMWAASALVVWLLLDRPPDDGGRWQRDLAAQDWSKSIITALARGLAHNPANRYDGAAAWFAALRDAAVPTAPLLLPPTTILSRSRSEVRQPPARPRRRALVAVALLLATVVGAASALTLERRFDNTPQQTVEVLEDGQVRTETSGDERSVTITGPTEVVVGEQAIFEGDTAGVKNMLWVAPNGDRHDDVSRLEITATTPGRATITLVGVDDEGRILQAAHVFRAIER
jgi:serine/threonine protein kinase